MNVGSQGNKHTPIYIVDQYICTLNNSFSLYVTHTHTHTRVTRRGGLSPASAVPSKGPKFELWLKKRQSEIDAAAVILAANRLMQYHLWPQCGL